MDTQDVLGPKLVDLAFNSFQVLPQLIDLEDVLHKDRFKA